jgi:hypothetical protein
MVWRNGKPGNAGFVGEQVLWRDSRVYWPVDVIEGIEVVREWVHRSLT